MSTMDREAFEARWAGLTLDQKTAILQDALETLCIDTGIPIPELNVMPGFGVNPNDPEGFIYGDYDPNHERITLYANTETNEGVAHFDDPWETINSIGHEFAHYFTDFNNLAVTPQDDEAGAQLIGDAMEQAWHDRYEQHGNFGPEQDRLQY